MSEPKRILSYDGYTPRHFLLGTAILHVAALVVFWPWVAMMFAGGIWALPNHPLDGVRYSAPLVCIIVGFVWAWRRRQHWGPAIAFLVASVAFWYCVQSLWRETWGN
jgi:hypothetical protein